MRKLGAFNCESRIAVRIYFGSCNCESKEGGALLPTLDGTVAQPCHQGCSLFLL